jgi:hypothetical protein
MERGIYEVRKEILLAFYSMLLRKLLLVIRHLILDNVNDAGAGTPVIRSDAVAQ